MAVAKSVAVIAEEPKDLKVERERCGVRAWQGEASRGNLASESATAKRAR
jgi:hypothetical protein